MPHPEDLKRRLLQPSERPYVPGLDFIQVTVAVEEAAFGVLGGLPIGGYVLEDFGEAVFILAWEAVEAGFRFRGGLEGV